MDDDKCVYHDNSGDGEPSEEFGLIVWENFPGPCCLAYGGGKKDNCAGESDLRGDKEHSDLDSDVVLFGRVRLLHSPVEAVFVSQEVELQREDGVKLGVCPNCCTQLEIMQGQYQRNMERSGNNCCAGSNSLQVAFRLTENPPRSQVSA